MVVVSGVKRWGRIERDNVEGECRDEVFEYAVRWGVCDTRG